MKVVHDERTARPDPKGVLVVCDRCALRGRQNFMPVLSELMELAAGATVKLLVVDGNGI